MAEPPDRGRSHAEQLAPPRPTSESMIGPPKDRGGRSPLFFVTGLAIAFIGAMCGIGGGLFTVPVLHFGFGLRLRRAVATSLLLVFATTTGATLTEVVSGQSAIHWPIVGFLALGILVGAQLGYPVSKRFDTHNLRGLFSIVIAIAAVRILFAGSHLVEPATEPITAKAIAYAATSGFFGGFVSPILGIGGGLVMVPALLLGPSALSFAGVRACSMAAAIVTSGRSLTLYWKERSIHPQVAPPLALGAFLGAVLGVSSVHQPGVIHYARVLLGLVLVFVSARFAIAWWKERESA